MTFAKIYIPLLSVPVRGAARVLRGYPGARQLVAAHDAKESSRGAGRIQRPFGATGGGQGAASPQLAQRLSSLFTMRF